MAWPYGNAYEKLCEDGAEMYVLTRERLTLEERGLARFEDYLSFAEGSVVNAHTTMRDVLRLEAPISGGRRELFLKRFRASHWKDALKDLLRFRRVRTRALHEFDMLLRFRREGLSVPDAPAVGERHVFGRDTGSFILISGLSGVRPLNVVLTEPEDAAARLDIIRSLARFVRGMHDAGLSHGELFAKHILVAERAGGRHFSLIDLQQAEEEKPAASRGRRARDLAALLVSLPPGEVKMRERVAFLREYLGKRRLGPGDLEFARTAVIRAAKRFTRRDHCTLWRAALGGPRE